MSRVAHVPILPVVTCVNKCMKSILPIRLSQACVYLVTDRASLFTDQRMSGLPIRAKYKHIKTISEQTTHNFPTDSSSSFLNWWLSKQGVETLYNFCVFLLAGSQYLSTHFFHEVSPIKEFFSCSSRDSWFEHSVSSKMVSLGLHSRWVHHQCAWSRNEVGSSSSTFFINFFRMGAILCLFPDMLISSACTDKNNPCFRWTNRHSQFGTSPIQVPKEFPQIVFPTRGHQVGDSTNFVQEEPLGLPCLTMIWSICVEESVSICIYGHPDFWK